MPGTRSDVAFELMRAFSGAQVPAVAIVARCVAIGLTELREHLSSRLPLSALPQVLVIVDKMPLTTKGTVPRARLASLLEIPCLNTSSELRFYMHSSNNGVSDLQLIETWGNEPTVQGLATLQMHSANGCGTVDHFLALVQNVVRRHTPIGEVGADSPLEAHLNSMAIIEVCDALTQVFC